MLGNTHRDALCTVCTFVHGWSKVFVLVLWINHSWVSSLSKLATPTLPARGSFSSLAEGKISKQMRTAPDIVIKIQSAARLTNSVQYAMVIKQRN